LLRLRLPPMWRRFPQAGGGGGGPAARAGEMGSAAGIVGANEHDRGPGRQWSMRPLRLDQIPTAERGTRGDTAPSPAATPAESHHGPPRRQQDRPAWPEHPAARPPRGRLPGQERGGQGRAAEGTPHCGPLLRPGPTRRHLPPAYPRAPSAT
jgi:hypothetical protein